MCVIAFDPFEPFVVCDVDHARDDVEFVGVFDVFAMV